MIKKIFALSNGQNAFLTLLASMLTFFLLTACAATGNIYGTLDRDRDLDNKFREYQVMQDYEYYTTGGYDKPNAILLIHKDYELDNPGNFWNQIPNVDYSQMRKWMYLIGSQEDTNRSGDYFAAYILDPDGNRVGVWYSVETFATVKFLGENRILVYTPELRRESHLSKVEKFEHRF